MKFGSEFDYLVPYETELVRVGPNGDCGYVIPKKISTSMKSLYSIGISTNWDFEIEMAKRNAKLRIFAYDRTSGWLVFSYIALRNLFIGDTSVPGGNSFRFRLKSCFEYLTLSIKFRSFFIGRRKFKRKWVRQDCGGNDEVSFKHSVMEALVEGPAMLKIDIEGGEYEFIDDLLDLIRENHKKIHCLIMEFHDTHVKRHDFERLVKGISEHLQIVHLHANNCAGVAADGFPEVVEITFAEAILFQVDLISHLMVLIFRMILICRIFGFHLLDHGASDGFFV